MRYAKLIFKNAKRSAKDYLVYVVTMTICVTLFYAFLSVSSSFYRPDIGAVYDVTMLGDSMKMAICAITLVLLFLIRYAAVQAKGIRAAVRNGDGAENFRPALFCGNLSDGSLIHRDGNPAGGVMLPVHHRHADEFLWPAL